MSDSSDLAEHMANMSIMGDDVIASIMNDDGNGDGASPDAGRTTSTAPVGAWRSQRQRQGPPSVQSITSVQSATATSLLLHHGKGHLSMS